MRYYLDTSAAVKLVRTEAESAALRTFLSPRGQVVGEPILVSSDLLQTELVGTVLRARLPLANAMVVMRSVYLYHLSPQICESAGLLVGTIGARSLDALHLATALAQRPSLTGLITYDLRLAEGAHSLGMTVVSPGHDRGSLPAPKNPAPKNPAPKNSAPEHSAHDTP